MVAVAAAHRRVKHRRHVGHHRRPLRHPSEAPQPVGLGQLVDRRGYHIVRLGGIAPLEQVDQRGILQSPVAGKIGDDGVDLGLVPVAGFLRAGPGHEAARSCAVGLREPPGGHRGGIAGCHHRGRGYLGAVGQPHAPHAPPVSEQPGHWRAVAQAASGCLERGGQRVGQGAAAAHRASRLDHVAHGVERAGQAGAGPVGRRPPNGGAVGDRRHDQGLVVEVGPQHVQRAGPAPLQQPGPAPPPSGQHPGQHPRR